MSRGSGAECVAMAKYVAELNVPRRRFELRKADGGAPTLATQRWRACGLRKNTAPGPLNSAN